MHEVQDSRHRQNQTGSWYSLDFVYRDKFKFSLMFLEAHLKENNVNRYIIPKVEPVDLCAIFGGHEQCPGVSTAGRADIRSLVPELVVACTCECHRKALQ